MQKLKKRKKLLYVFLFIFLSAIVFSAFDVRLKIQSYTIPSDSITEEIKMVLLTDLHSCKYGKKETKLITAIKEQHPDIILLGGDICDDDIPNDNTEYLLQGIANQYPCYYVTGNHEYWSNDIETILTLFQSYNVTILDGDCVTVTIHGQEINICGITDPDISAYTDTLIGVPEQLKKLKNANANGNYTILLAHRPELVSLYTEYPFDLILTGHAHGGQFRLPGLINGLYAPNQGWFPEYAGGEYIINNTRMIVSRGLARESTRVPRIYNRPELVTITLTANEEIHQ